MAKKTIPTQTGHGIWLYEGFDMINDNFDELYPKSYGTISQMLSNQAEQIEDGEYFVYDASADNDLNFSAGDPKQAVYRFKGTANNNLTDYDLVASPYGLLSEGAPGSDGKTPYIQGGFWYIDGVSTGVKAEGVDGQDGNDGISPHIDATTGNWFIGAVDTGVEARGPQGPPGTGGGSAVENEIKETTVSTTTYQVDLNDNVGLHVIELTQTTALEFINIPPLPGASERTKYIVVDLLISGGNNFTIPPNLDYIGEIPLSNGLYQFMLVRGGTNWEGKLMEVKLTN